MLINPENDHEIEVGDKILVLAEDNDSYEVNEGEFKIDDVGKVPQLKDEVKQVEKILFCGWRRGESFYVYGGCMCIFLVSFLTSHIF